MIKRIIEGETVIEIYSVWQELINKIMELEQYGAKFEPYDNAAICEVGFKNERAFMLHYPFRKDLKTTSYKVNSQQEFIDNLNKLKEPIIWGQWPKQKLMGAFSYEDGYNGICKMIAVRAGLHEGHFNIDFIRAITNKCSAPTPLFDHMQCCDLKINESILNIKELLL